VPYLHKMADILQPSPCITNTCRSMIRIFSQIISLKKVVFAEFVVVHFVISIKMNSWPSYDYCRVKFCNLIVHNAGLTVYCILCA
jgi:hypothetical protein